ncbi:MAG: rhodanese-like domain-containing protein [Burkholderiaceae bacterium]
MKSMVKQAMPLASPWSSPHRTHAANRRTLLLGALAVSLSSMARAQPAPGNDLVSLETARAEHEAGRVLMIDIREPNEHASGVAPGVKLLPMSQMGARLAEIPKDGKQPVLLICNSQNRSRAALKALRQLGGYEHVRYVEGGMSGWARRGWPMVAPAR